MSHYDFFQNRECEYFPCHPGADPETFSCLFCYCPLYSREHCPGNASWLKRGDIRIKVCSDCTFPHRPENYDIIMGILKNAVRGK